MKIKVKKIKNSKLGRKIAKDRAVKILKNIPLHPETMQ